MEYLCDPNHASRGGPSIPPDRHFRILLVGSFEDIDSQRGIAWRCADSLSLRSFLFLKADEAAPDHSSLTRIRDRLLPDVYEGVFQFVLRRQQMSRSEGKRLPTVRSERVERSFDHERARAAAIAGCGCGDRTKSTSPG